MITDPIADSLTIIRNAARAHKTSVTLRISKLTEAVIAILQREGYVENFKTFNDKQKRYARVHLKYRADKEPVFRTLRRISKPGLRRYTNVNSVPRPLNGMGMAILSTSKGIVSDAEARKLHVGGEILCEVW